MVEETPSTRIPHFYSSRTWNRPDLYLSLLCKKMLWYPSTACLFSDRLIVQPNTCCRHCVACAFWLHKLYFSVAGITRFFRSVCVFLCHRKWGGEEMPPHRRRCVYLCWQESEREWRGFACSFNRTELAAFTWLHEFSTYKTWEQARPVFRSWKHTHIWRKEIFFCLCLS